jgi:hypothetical protein
MGEPPLEAGALQEMSADATSSVASTSTGAPGTVIGVAEAGADAVPYPIALSSRTDTLSLIPLVRPAMVNDEPVVPVETNGPPLSE